MDDNTTSRTGSTPTVFIAKWRTPAWNVMLRRRADSQRRSSATRRHRPSAPTLQARGGLPGSHASSSPKVIVRSIKARTSAWLCVSL